MFIVAFLIKQRLHHCFHPGQRVADLVRQPHCQFAHGRHLFGLEYLAVEFAPLVLQPTFLADVAHHKDIALANIIPGHRSDVEGHGSSMQAKVGA
ncbi:MAG: hypothetical protein A3G18_03495 [Rhodospirillales bacterium RIFCSPLOWO2_12_FULL_58_28]|nr:MAG: hypothetical protein A3G18_03495 [Rhodospirillales bacterium RIFCSPLOWO2_12_FULL_58_28]